MILNSIRRWDKRLWRTKRNAASIALLAFVGVAVLSACGQDKETEALRQENAALRREAENRGPINDMIAPPSASARAAVGLSPGASSAQKSTAGNAGAADLSESDINNANRLGLPIYPNSKLSRQPGAPDNSVLTGGGVNIVLLETTDKLEPIVAFYTEKMAASNTDPNMHGANKQPGRADRVQDKFRVVTLSDVQPGGMRSVTVHEDVGRCYIELMNMAGKLQIPASVLPTGVVKSSATGKAPPGTSAGTSTVYPATSFGPPSTGQQPENDPLKPPLLLPRGKQ